MALVVKLPNGNLLVPVSGTLAGNDILGEREEIAPDNEEFLLWLNLFNLENGLPEIEIPNEP